jgi:hypothetical protein
MNIFQLAGIAALVALVAYNVTNQKIFAKVRQWIHVKCHGTKLNKLCELVECHYCFSHWVAAVLLYVSGRPPMHILYNWMDWPISWAIIVIIAQPIMVATDWSIDMMNSFFHVCPKKCDCSIDKP